MKIALVILHADSARGGAERYTLDLADGLVQRGHDVSTLASSFQESSTAGHRVLLGASGATRTRRYLTFLDSVDRELDCTKYDVVHAMLPVWRCDFYHPHAGVAAEAVTAGHLQKPGALGRSLSWIGNRFNTRRNQFASVERALLTSNSPPRVFCLSKLLARVVHQYYPGLPDDRLVSLFNGIDLQRFDPAQNPKARQTIRDRFGLNSESVVGLMLAQDFERKGLAQAIAAMALVPDAKMVLLVGGRPDPSSYRKLAAANGISDRVIFAGPVAKPVDFYRSADFFVLPTFFDPCSLVVLEALAMGLPVVSTSRNGACEIMQDGVHGKILTDPADVESLATAIRPLQSVELREKMSNACLKLRPQLSQETHLERVENGYRSATESRAGKPHAVTTVRPITF